MDIVPQSVWKSHNKGHAETTARVVRITPYQVQFVLIGKDAGRPHKHRRFSMKKEAFVAKHHPVRVPKPDA